MPSPFTVFSHPDHKNVVFMDEFSYEVSLFALDLKARQARGEISIERFDIVPKYKIAECVYYSYSKSSRCCSVYR